MEDIHAIAQRFKDKKHTLQQAKNQVMGTNYEKEEDKTYSQIPGLFQLNNNIVERLVRRVLPTVKKETALNTSGYTLDLMIYFSTVCDNDNKICDFSYKEVSEFSNMSERNFYYCIQALKKFGFVTFESTGHGTIDIVILNNDPEDNKKQGYFNTNRAFFFHGTKEHEAYQKLSVYAKKLLLLFLCKYNKHYGLTIKLSTLTSYLCIKNSSLIVSYIKELTTLLGSNFCKLEDCADPKVVIPKNIYALLPYGDYSAQDTYLKRTIRKMIHCYHCLYLDNVNNKINHRSFKKEMIREIAGMFLKYVSLKVPFQQLLERFSKCLHNRPNISHAFLYSLNIEFKELDNQISLA